MMDLIIFDFEDLRPSLSITLFLYNATMGIRAQHDADILR